MARAECVGKLALVIDGGQDMPGAQDANAVEDQT
jgi:hypothetical protein